MRVAFGKALDEFGFRHVAIAVLAEPESVPNEAGSVKKRLVWQFRLGRSPTR
jgi:hypothetical protein